MKKLVILAMATLSACASIHPGKIAPVTDPNGNKDLVVSGLEVSDQKDQPFALLAMTFENKGDDWIRIAKIDVILDEEAAKTVSVVVGQDLVDWADAQQTKTTLEAHNTKMKRLGVAGLGLLVAAVAKDRFVSSLGTATAVGMATWSVTDVIAMRRALANNPKYVPDEHLYRPFSVPGKLFVRKWVLLNKKSSQRIASLPIEITYVDGRKEIRNGEIIKEIR